MKNNFLLLYLFIKNYIKQKSQKQLFIKNFYFIKRYFNYS